MKSSNPRKSDHKPSRAGNKPMIAGELLAWYDSNRRVLPWRAKHGARPNPYRVWLSEIMLQQTTVRAVDGYYRAFVKRWPNVTSLANASLDEILAAWAGLGYYSRARNLHRTARLVAFERGGRFPKTSDELRKLPGIGSYTAGAIASIAFGERVPAIDANAERVLARLCALAEPLSKIKKRLAALADALVPAERPGDFAQALMDLGSLICTPKRPSCGICPIAGQCLARMKGEAEQIPLRNAISERPTKRGVAYVAIDRRNFILLERRPENGLLGGMTQPPLGEWRPAFPARAVALKEVPFPGRWSKVPGTVRHSFTHFHLEIEVYVAHFERRPKYKGMWVARESLGDAALPTAMRKLVHHALDAKQS